MKLRLMILMVIVAPCILCAQEQETLFSGDIEHGGYGCFVAKGSPVRGQMQLFLGGYGGWFINHTFMIGLGGYGMSSKLSAADNVPKIQNRTLDVEMGYGGFMAEYTMNSNKIIHFSGQLLLGAGAATYSWNSQFTDDATDFQEAPVDSFFTAEFGANVEFNIASFFRMGVGGSYRFATGLDIVGLTDKDISGPAANITLKFGKF